MCHSVTLCVSVFVSLSVCLCVCACVPVSVCPCLSVCLSVHVMCVFQRVLKDIMSEKLPTLYGHFTTHQCDLSLFTFNWFLVLFVDGLPVNVFLRIWDSFLYEGSKVTDRYQHLYCCWCNCWCTFRVKPKHLYN